MPDGAEYPKAIYRDGGSEMLWGKAIETSCVGCAEEEAEALAGGWRLHPDPKQTEAVEPRRRGRPPKEHADDA